MSSAFIPEVTAQPMRRSSIEWVKKSPRELICPACGASGPKPFVLAANTSWVRGGHLDLFACPHCDSKFFPDLRSPEYERFEDVDAYLQFYLEIGAGIDQLVRHLFAVPLRPGAQYLEIGCGFGFALDFARQAFKLHVLGIDPSPFAGAGARLLDLPVVEGYLTPKTDLHGRCFDLAVASEVIEHVFDPLSFIRLIVGHLSPGGVLILSTPNAANVAPDTPRGALMPLLSPGWHYILYSRKSLERLLREAGFRRVEVAVRQHTLVAAATNGDAPMDLDAELDRDIFRSYLEERRKTIDCDGALAYGLAYRLLKELTNSKQYQQALELYKELRLRFLSAYGFDIEMPHARWLYPLSDESLCSFATRYPMCLCGIAYLRGILALNCDAESGGAVHFFSLSSHHGDLLRELLQGVGSDDAETEVLVERSRVLYLRALAHTAPEEAAAGASRLLQEKRNRALSYPEQSEDIMAILPHLVNLGALEAAEDLAPEAEAFLGSGSLSDRGCSEVQRALGQLEMNRRYRPRRAALHFALAERAAHRWHRDEPAQEAMEQIWRTRHNRLLAWVVAGNALRALLVGRLFERAETPKLIPNGILESATKLISQASASIASGADQRT